MTSTADVNILDVRDAPTSPSHCNVGVQMAGDVFYAISIMMVFISLSIHLGSKSNRAQMSPANKRGLFILAQCSTVIISAFGGTSSESLSPKVTALVAGAFTTQFGFEPYFASGWAALSKIWTRSLHRKETKMTPGNNGSDINLTEQLLKVLLAFAVGCHHFCTILMPLWLPCLPATTLEAFPLFVAGLVLLGCIAGLSESPMVRAGTDVAAIACYVACLITFDMGSNIHLALVWVTIATIGDSLIAVQLILWAFLVERRTKEVLRSTKDEMSSTTEPKLQPSMEDDTIISAFCEERFDVENQQ